MNEEHSNENDQQTTTPSPDEALAALTAERDEARDSLAAARAEQAASNAAARDALRAANPHLRPDAIDGSNAAELAAAVAREQATYDHYRAAAGSNGHAAPRVPHGGTPAPTVDTSKMTARERIAYGLSLRG